jgi:hypothetical protein
MSSKNQTIKNFFLRIQISNINQKTSKENVSTKRPLSTNDFTDISTKKSMYDLATSSSSLTYNNCDISLFCNKTVFNIYFYNFFF